MTRIPSPVFRTLLAGMLILAGYLAADAGAAETRDTPRLELASARQPHAPLPVTPTPSPSPTETPLCHTTPTPHPPFAGDPPAVAIVQRQVAHCMDDAAERVDKAEVIVDWNYIPTGGRPGDAPGASVVLYQGGFVFRDVRIPQAARIISATLQLNAIRQYGLPVALRIAGDDRGNATDFSAANLPLHSRPRTDARVPWSFAAAFTGWQSSPDIGGIVQELVGRVDWRPGNNLGLLVDPATSVETNYTTWRSYDGMQVNAARLVVSYELLATATPTRTPTIAPTVTPSATPTATRPRTPTSTPAAPPGGSWVSGFGPLGLDSWVSDLAVGPDGSLYAGGDFAIAGDVAANRIARWDGAAWQPLGSGMNNTIYALAVGPDGSLYAGGAFTTAGGVAAKSIARWDGAAWQPLGSGMNNTIHALAVGPDGSLYAGGDFAIAGDVAASRIARWDGTAWHPLGSGMNGAVFALAFGPDGSLYAAGVFTSAGGVAAKSIARWDGAAWHPLGTGSGMNSYVRVLAFGPDGSLYAGGDFTSAGGVAAKYIAHWDGAVWHPVGSGMGGDTDPSVYALAVGSDGSLYAGGRFTTAGGVEANYIARWDGAAWHPLGSGMSQLDGNVSALAVAKDGSLYAGGYFSIAGGVTAKNIARWDTPTSSWHPLGSGSGMNNEVFALAFGPDESLYAGGSFTTAGDVTANYVARWDGTAWRPLGSGMNQNGWVLALAVAPDGSLYAGGGFDTAGGVAAESLARWDGTAWQSVGSGVSQYGGVSALAVGPDGSLYAGGSFTSVGGVEATYIARWDGTTWHPLGSGMNSYVLVLAFGPDGSLYAGGYFDTAGGVTVNRIARWDGASWHPLGGGMGDTGNPYVEALAVGPDGSLYAGGSFTTVGGVTAYHIARWDGTSWHPLGSGMGGTVLALALESNGLLDAGGDFSTAGGVPANSIARWDTPTSSWRLFGTGMGGRVTALAVGRDGSLYAGGRFGTAGGVPSSNIARWTGEVEVPTPTPTPTSIPGVSSVQHLGAPLDVLFVDPTHGWSQDGARRTSDGGQTWSWAHAPTSNIATFVSPTEGWAGGHYRDTGGEQCFSFIDHTTDGGSTWSRQYTSRFYSGPCYLDRLSFVDSLYGWGFGYPHSARTTDGGLTWQPHSVDYGAWLKMLDRTTWFRLDPEYGPPDIAKKLSKTTDAGATWAVVGDLPLWAIAPSDATDLCKSGPYIAPDGKTLVVVGQAGHIARSTDGGATWIEAPPPVTENLSWVAFAGSAVGWAAGSGGAVIRTSDGGLTWARQQINTTHDVTWLAAFSPNEALLRADRLYRTTDGGNSWVALPNPTEATITDLAPASTDVVWASAGNVLATTDGGASWQELNIAASAVDAVDERHAWALGSQVWRTTDGGGHWQGLGGPSGARDLDFVSATRGWLLAPHSAPATACLGIYSTTDGGVTWQEEPQDPTWDCSAAPERVNFVDDQHGWLSSKDTLLRTTDGGASWQLTWLCAGLCDALSGRYSFVSDVEVWMAYSSRDPAPWYYTHSNYVYHATDGGISWQVVDYMQVATEDPIYFDVSFLDTTEGWVVGSDGWIRHTTDGGATWQDFYHPSGMSLRSVAAAAPGVAYIGGEFGLILRYDITEAETPTPTPTGTPTATPGASATATTTVTATPSPAPQHIYLPVILQR